MEEFNLHLTGDIHAITAANNLLAAQVLLLFNQSLRAYIGTDFWSLSVVMFNRSFTCVLNVFPAKGNIFFSIINCYIDLINVL
jgi:hypothetical protein